MKTTILLFTLVTSLTLVTSNKVFSQTTSTSGNTDIRLQQIENKTSTESSKVATTSATPKLNSISFLDGKVLTISSSVLVLDCENGTKAIYTTDSTKFINLDSSGKKLIGFGDLKIGDTIQVLGLNPAESTGTAKIIVRSSVINGSNTFSLIARISDISEGLINLKNYTRDDLALIKVSYDSSVLINSGSKTLKITDLKPNNKVVTAGTIDNKGTLLAKEILVFNSP